MTEADRRASGDAYLAQQRRDWNAAGLTLPAKATHTAPGALDGAGVAAADAKAPIAPPQGRETPWPPQKAVEAVARAIWLADGWVNDCPWYSRHARAAIAALEPWLRSREGEGSR